MNDNTQGMSRADIIEKILSQAKFLTRTWLYDTIRIPAAGPGTQALDFFRTGRGQGVSAVLGAGNKTYADTNLEQNAQLQNGEVAVIDSIWKFYWANSTTPTVAGAAVTFTEDQELKSDINQFEGGVGGDAPFVELTLAGSTTINRWPLISVPTTTLPGNASGDSVDNQFRFTRNGALVINEDRRFEVNVVPTSTAAIPSGNDLILQFVLGCWKFSPMNWQGGGQQELEGLLAGLMQYQERG